VSAAHCTGVYANELIICSLDKRTVLKYLALHLKKELIFCYDSLIADHVGRVYTIFKQRLSKV